MKGIVISMKKGKNKFLIIILINLMIFCFIMAGTLPVNAETPDSDGIYTVNVSNDMPMGGSNLSSSATLEKINGIYYLSLTFNTAKLSNPRLSIDGKTVGYQITDTDGDKKTYRYTLSENSLSSVLPFVVDVIPMGTGGINREFNVSVDLNSATRTNGTISYEDERPAEFIPVLTTNAGSEYILKTGTFFTIPSANATLGSERCNVVVDAYFVDGENLKPVTIENNRIFLESAGEYLVIYTASDSSYKTSHGNDTYTEYRVKILSQSEDGAVVKYEDNNGVLPKDAVLQASGIKTGVLFNVVSDKMQTISDNFEVYDINIYSPDGGPVTLFDTVSMYIRLNPKYNENKIEVYYLNDEGMLGKLDCTVYDNYVMFETDRLGTFIVCVPGVAFVMPMWGYAIISVVGFLIISGVITLMIVKRKNGKKRRPI